MSGAEHPVVVLFGYDAAPGPSLDRLLALARCLRADAVNVHVVLVGDQGDQGGIAELGKLGELTVVDHLRTRGVGALIGRVGLPVLSSRWKHAALRLARRRWSDYPFVLVDDRAAPLAGATGGAMPWASTGRTHLHGRADARAAVSLGPDAPPGVIALDPSVLDHVDRPGEDPDRWPVLLVPTPHAWDEINHTIEAACHLRLAWPEVAVRWVADGEEDRWLAEHDLAAVGLPDDVPVVDALEAAATAARLVVLTGYGRVDDGLLARARSAGLPVLGFGAQADAPGLAPFAIEALLRSIDVVLSAPGWRDRAQRTVAARAEARRDHAAAVAELRRALGLPRARSQGAPPGPPLPRWRPMKWWK